MHLALVFCSATSGCRKRQGSWQLASRLRGVLKITTQSTSPGIPNPGLLLKSLTSVSKRGDIGVKPYACLNMMSDGSW